MTVRSRAERTYRHDRRFSTGLVQVTIRIANNVGTLTVDCQNLSFINTGATLPCGTDVLTLAESWLLNGLTSLATGQKVLEQVEQSIGLPLHSLLVAASLDSL